MWSWRWWTAGVHVGGRSPAAPRRDHRSPAFHGGSAPFELDLRPGTGDSAWRKSPRFTGLSSLFTQEEEGSAAAVSHGDSDERSRSRRKRPSCSTSPARSGAEEIVFLGGPRASIFLDLESYTGYQTILLEHPARLVIDLYGVQGDPRPCWKWTAPWSVLCGPAALMTRPCGLSAT